MNNLNKIILKKFDEWFCFEENYFSIITSAEKIIINNSIVEVTSSPFIKNYQNFFKKKTIKKKKSFFFSNQSENTDLHRKKNYDFFFSLQGVILYKGKLKNNNKSKFYVTFKFHDKFNLTFTQHELFKNKKKFNEVKINDTMEFFFFFNKDFLKNNEANLFSENNIFEYTTWRQFFIIPNNASYMNHLLNFTSNDKLFELFKKRSLSYLSLNYLNKISSKIKFTNSLWLHFDKKVLFIFLSAMRIYKIYFFTVLYRLKKNNYLITQKKCWNISKLVF